MPPMGFSCALKGSCCQQRGPAARYTAQQTRPAQPLQPHLRENTGPARHQTPAFGHCEHAGRQIPRTARRNMATLKPTTPLHAPNKGPLKPPSPLRPQTAPKTLISHPQRRRRFQTHTGTSKQRRQGFQLRLSLREQRRRRFHTTGPPGRQGQAAVPAGPEAMSGPAISHLVSPTRTLTR